MIKMGFIYDPYLFGCQLFNEVENNLSTKSPPNNDNYKHNNNNFSKEWAGGRGMEWNLVAWTLGSLLAGSTS